ncbi:PAS domain-containing protein [Gilvimarinus agarilyticus]|uniref:PAS domain-containing protein n=1 Tax=Reichenbachiella agariperforans TaxID=156994 RepID=UPI001C0A5F3E|nr:PAS domain-containing protein [Reichenbachiella agariperforans]MBU2887936.1 PAS domain-containing protein [Gilvimarinus agarilyticus]MBU2913384.1 PAS domain-containing protein [Reichenbachiella agariperforans]
MQTAREYNDCVLIGVSKAINELIINQNFEEALDRSLQHIGQAFDGDVFVAEVSLTPGKEMVLSVKHHWMKVYSQKRLAQNTNKPLAAFAQIFELLKAGKSYAFKKSTADLEISRHLELTGGKSGVVFPIFVRENLWGTLSLNSMEEERDWGEATLSVLQSFACAIGSILTKIIYRNSLEQDIVQQSQQIVETNRRYQSLVHNIPGVVFRCAMDQSWTMVYISPYVEELTGYEASQFLAPEFKKSFAELIHPNDRDFIWMEINRQLKKGPSYKVNYRIVDLQGTTKWLWEQGTVQENSHGEASLEGCIIDITDRVESHEKVMAATLATEDRERRYFSREIHDNLQQILTTAHLNLQHAKRKLMNPKAQAYIESASGSVNEAIAETRSLSHKLMPKTIQDYGYVAAVAAMIDNIRPTTSTKFDFQHNLGSDGLPEDVALCLYRITQEAITNIMKYAQAKEATIQLMRHQSMLILTIDDNGIGFESDVLDPAKGFGLNNMSNRATALGGKLEVDSAVGKGTHILVEVPYQTENQDDRTEIKDLIGR